jgi:hypothetical protein
MTDFDDWISSPTGEEGDSPESARERARQRGRRRAIAVITNAEDSLPLASDGGLHPDTIRWLAANPEASTQAALKYDRARGPYRGISEQVPETARGEPGSPQNYARSVEVNAARAAIRQYRDLEGRTD